jgi:hypothetical protein
MSNQRLQHDVAFASATALLDVVGLALPPEHQKDIFDEFYSICKSGIDAYEMHRDGMQERLKPGTN